MKRRRGFTWIELLISAIITLTLFLYLGALFNKARRSFTQNYCPSSLKQIGVGFLQYAQDNDERFPPVSVSDVKPVGMNDTKSYKPFGWADAANSYIRDTNVFQCPNEELTTAISDQTQSGYTDYWFNSNLSNVKLNVLASPAQTILSGDGNDGTDMTNARYSLNALPPAWLDTEGSPARRHLDTANYLFADGHVKSFRPQQITTLPTTQSSSTFSIR